MVTIDAVDDHLRGSAYDDITDPLWPNMDDAESGQAEGIKRRRRTKKKPAKKKQKKTIKKTIKKRNHH